MLHCVSTAVSTSKKWGDYAERSVTSVILLTAERVYSHFSFQMVQEHIIYACKKQIVHTAKMTSQYLHSVTFLYFVISVEVLEKMEITNIPWSTSFCFKHCFYFYVCYLNVSLCELLPWKDSACHQYAGSEQRHFCPQWAKSILQKLDIHYTCRQKGSWLLAVNKTLQKTKEEAEICNGPTTFLKKWDDHQRTMLLTPQLVSQNAFCKIQSAIPSN